MRFPAPRLLLLIAAAISCLAIGEPSSGQNPPFSGTVWIDPDIIRPTDPTNYQLMAYGGIASRLVFDRRDNAFSTKSMHIFDAVYADDLPIEVQVNSSDFSMDAAEQYAETYADMVGRLPRSLRSDVQTMCIHGGGALPFGGGNNSILVHVDVEPTTVPYLEEILFHEATHTSYGPEHDAAPGWLGAQQSDATFISTYARDFPAREDVAESLLMWYAVRHRSDRVDASVIEATLESMPNRLSYFDALPFETGSFPAGDFNENFVVEPDDLALWRAGYGMAASATHGDGDADGDHDVDGSDMLVWQRELGLVVNSSASVERVPEPLAGPIVLAVALTLVVLQRLGGFSGSKFT